jgi:mRNA interferase MazF
MRQGELWYANLNPTKGSEQSGRRPVLIISGDTLNETLSIVIVVPISSKIKGYPTCITLHPNRTNGLKNISEAIPFQVRTVSNDRLTKRIGHASIEEVKNVIRGLVLTLTL